MSKTTLVYPIEEAQKILEARISAGENLLNEPITTQDHLDKSTHKRDMWHEYNIELLRRIFDLSHISDDYVMTDVVGWYGATLPAQIMELHESTRNYVRFLRSLINRLDLYVRHDAVGSKANVTKSREIFVVHGHDHGTKEEVARVLEKLELLPIILHEQANQGRTIIEKFEYHSSVAYAIVILSPDDMGYLKDSDGILRPRARQNVIFELGYFYGKLGRNRVCALITGEMEQPSDIIGVTYIQKNGGEWILNLCKELKAADLKVDLSKL